MRLFLTLALPLALGCPREAVQSASPAASTMAPTGPAPSEEVRSAPAAPFILTYAEEGGAISFAPPRTVRLEVGGTTRCLTELGDNGNMWTGGDVSAALTNPEVQSALRDAGLYRSSYGPSTVTTATGRITWVTAWREVPPPEPLAVHHLHEVLHVVLANRKVVCAS